MNADTETIYLDHNATTPVDPEVRELMLRLLSEGGNPSSSHPAGRRARAAVERAREQVSALLGADPAGLVFTGGGTEANNHALRGVVAARGGGGVVTSAVEHPAVSEVARHLAGLGHPWREVGVDGGGRVSPDDVVAAVDGGTAVVSIMHANNEVGAVQPVAEIARRLSGHAAVVHTDAAQSLGKIPVDVEDLRVDLLSLAGHKLCAPKGVGALWIRPGVEVANLMFGAGHEGGRRPGTENVASIAGLGLACELAGRRLSAEVERLAALRDEMQAALLSECNGAVVHGLGGPRLPNTLSIGFPGRTASDLMDRMGSVAVSAGAACHAEGVTVSHVLRAMDVPVAVAAGTLRISLGHTTTADEVRSATLAIVRAVRAG